MPASDKDSILCFSWETQFPFEANSALSGSHTSSHLVCPFPRTALAPGSLNLLQLNHYSPALAVAASTPLAMGHPQCHKMLPQQVPLPTAGSPRMGEETKVLRLV